MLLENKNTSKFEIWSFLFIYTKEEENVYLFFF